MSIRLCIMMSCLLLSACQTVQGTRFSSLWSSDDVVGEVSDAETPSSYHTPASADAVQDPNKLLTMTDVSGNREFLYLDSIAQERGVITALIEFRYVKEQTLPANGMLYHYNQWREQIDCQHKVRILRNTTHYNDAGEIVDSIDYPVPKYKPADWAALAQPNDKVIQEVCQRVGAHQATPPAETETTPHSPATSTPDMPTHEQVSGSNAAENATENTTEKPSKSKKKDKKSNKKETGVPVDMKTDFISKGKAEMSENTPPNTPTADAPKTESPSETKPKESPTASTQNTPAEKPSSKKEKRKKSNKKDTSTTPTEHKETNPTEDKANQVKLIELPSEATKKSVVSPLQDGEIPLVPVNSDAQ